MKLMAKSYKKYKSKKRKSRRVKRKSRSVKRKLRYGRPRSIDKDQIEEVIIQELII